MSSTKEDSPSARVQKSFQLLSTSASELNAISDRLGKGASQFDAIFQKLSLGISGWVRFYDAHSEEGDQFWFNEIGYAKVNGKWGLAIRSVMGYEHMDGWSEYEEWLFNDAPRALRVNAVDKVPDLFEKLTGQVAATTKLVDKKAKLFEEWLSAISLEGGHTLKELGTGQVGKK